MNAFWLSLLFKAIMTLAGGNLFDLVKQLVIVEAGTTYVDIPATANSPAISANQQRKLAVLTQLKLIKGDLQAKIKSMGGWLVSILIDAAVGKLQDAGVLPKSV